MEHAAALRCPLCGADNGCALASGSVQACWCSREAIPKAGLSALFAAAGLEFPAPAEAARCVCAACSHQARLIAPSGDDGRAAP
jgi:hypothetical protein